MILHDWLYAIKTGRSSTGSQRGFTVLELAIVVAIVGVMSAGGMVMYNNYVREAGVEVTEERADKVLDAISIYAQRYNRLPCAADPAANNGIEKSGGNCIDISSAAMMNNESMGVLPWRTLGLSKDDVKDAWGRFYSYKPAPSLTINVSAAQAQVAASAGNDVIHNSCRTPSWYTNAGGALTTPVHVNREKAMFCCNAPPPVNYTGGTLPAGWRDVSSVASGAGFRRIAPDPPDFEEGQDVGESQPPRSMPINANYQLPADTPVMGSNAWIDKRAGSYGSFDDIQDDPAVPDSAMMSASGIALTLISHGPDGDYAYADNGQMIAGDTDVAEERAYAQAPQAVAANVYHPKASAGMVDRLGNRADATDDMVVSLRSDQIYSRVGTATCVKPAASTMDTEVVDTDCPTDSTECVPRCDSDGSTSPGECAPCTSGSAPAFPVQNSTLCKQYYVEWDEISTVDAVSVSSSGVTLRCDNAPPIYLAWTAMDRDTVPGAHIASYDAAVEAATGGDPNSPFWGCLPASCGSRTITWKTNATPTYTDPNYDTAVCSGVIPPAREGSTANVADNSNPAYGRATFRCEGGEWRGDPEPNSAFCGCGPQGGVTWQALDGGTCTESEGPLPEFYPGVTAITADNSGYSSTSTGQSNGGHSTVTDNSLTNPGGAYTGESDWYCQQGTWTFVCGNCEN